MTSSCDACVAAEILADGYHPAEKTFTVNEGVITNLSIQLVPLGFVSVTPDADPRTDPSTGAAHPLQAFLVTSISCPLADPLLIPC